MCTGFKSLGLHIAAVQCAQASRAWDYNTKGD